MKPKIIVLVVCSIAVFLGLAFVPLPVTRPTITFVECHTSAAYQKVAVFVITNSSRETFSYYGYGPTIPHYQAKVQTESGWQPHYVGWCGVGAELHALRPHDSVEFEVRGIDTPFEISLYFQHGTPDEIAQRYVSKHAAFSRWLRRVTHFEGFQPTFTWSQPVTLQN
jgi:hypothetical protein